MMRSVRVKLRQMMRTLVTTSSVSSQVSRRPRVGWKYFVIFTTEIFSGGSAHPGVVEGLHRAVVTENVIQSELSLDVPDGGDDVDDVVIVHLQGNIVT